MWLWLTLPIYLVFLLWSVLELSVINGRDLPPSGYFYMMPLRQLLDDIVSLLLLLIVTQLIYARIRASTVAKVHSYGEMVHELIIAFIGVVVIVELVQREFAMHRIREIYLKDKAAGTVKKTYNIAARILHHNHAAGTMENVFTWVMSLELFVVSVLHALREHPWRQFREDERTKKAQFAVSLSSGSTYS
jgi:hypothetical protein